MASIDKFPSRRAGLWCFYYEDLIEEKNHLLVSIPASGIMVFLQKILLPLLAGGILFPSRRAGLWCFYCHI